MDADGTGEDGGDDEDDALRKPKARLVIRDQLRQIDFAPAVGCRRWIVRAPCR